MYLFWFLSSLKFMTFFSVDEEMVRRPKTTKFEKLLFIFIEMALVNIPMVLLVYLENPSRTMHYTSLVSNENSFKIVLVIIFAVFELIFTSFNWFTILFHIFFSYTYILLSSIWLKNLKYVHFM